MNKEIEGHAVTTSKKISINGILQKKGPMWTTTLPVVNISSHGLTATGCLENAISTIIELLGKKIHLEFKIDDDLNFFISSNDAETFLNFIHERILSSPNHITIMTNLKRYITTNS